jgi:hypothetical protein
MTSALVVVAVVVLVLLYAATRPDTLHVERSAQIQAAATDVFPLISDFHNWSAWSPYETRDPGMKKGYSGAFSGKGAVYNWAGNNQVGEGRMEITEVTNPTRVTIALDFVRPFKGHNIATFTLTPGMPTTVTWAVDGPLAYPVKVMSLFMSMDSMMGRDFATGLANMKALAEQR